MALYLFLLAMLLPVAELMILVRIGEATAWWVPIAVVVCNGIAGAALARWQGLRVLQRIRHDTQANRMPADAMVDGSLILLAGVLLIIPGVLTDVLGIALLIPPLRALVKRGATAWLRRSVQVRVIGTNPGEPPRADGLPTARHDEIIDARVINTRVEDANSAR